MLTLSLQTGKDGKVRRVTVDMGAPVLEPSNRVIAQLRAVLGKEFPIIGVGGIMSGDDAVSKIRAGADVVQIYTGLIYRGPDLITQAARAIQRLRTAGEAQKA